MEKALQKTCVSCNVSLYFVCTFFFKIILASDLVLICYFEYFDYPENTNTQAN